MSFSKLFNGQWDNKEMRILMVGLNGAGKTTIIHKLNLGEVAKTSTPTLGNYLIIYLLILFLINLMNLFFFFFFFFFFLIII